VVTKPAKEFTDATSRRKLKGSMDIELAVDAMELAERGRNNGVVSAPAAFELVAGEARACR